jgi:hypothetical protein
MNDKEKPSAEQRNGEQLKRYCFSTAVTSVYGHQYWHVDAAIEEEAREIAERGDAVFESEELEVQDFDSFVLVDVVDVPEASPAPAPSDASVSNERAMSAFESYLAEQKWIPGMPGLNARPCFVAGYNAALAQTAPVGEASEEIPLEAWHGERKVTIYSDCVIRVWGANIETEMSDEPRTLQSVQDAMEWLFATPPASREALTLSERAHDAIEIIAATYRTNGIADVADEIEALLATAAQREGK